MGHCWSWKLLVLVLLSGDVVRGDRCPQKGCAATFEPVISHDGQVYLNSCIAACNGAIIVRGGNPGAAAGHGTAASRRASPSVLLRYAAEGYVFVGFAQTQKLLPLQHATAAASGAPPARRSISANIMQQLVQPHSVLRYDVAAEAVYNLKAAGAQLDLSQLPGGVSYAAMQPQDPVPSPAPIDANGGDATGDDKSDDEEPYILEPEIVIDLPTKRNSGSPSPSPASPGDSSSSSTSPSPAMPEAGDNSSSSSSPAPAVDGGEAPASPSPSMVPSAGTATDSNPIPSPAVSAAPDAIPASTTDTTVADSDSSSPAGRKLRFVRKGNDERTDISSSPAFPLSAVGQLRSRGQDWHCSASLIAERTIITAAHCVYDPVTGSWAKSLVFAPSQFRDAAGSVMAPAGSAAVAEVFIVGGFAVGEPQFIWEKDMAVVKLAVGTKLGSKLGHLGVFLPAAIAHQQHALRVGGGERADVPASSGSTTGSGRKLMLQLQQATAGAGSSSISGKAKKSMWSGMLSTAGYPMDRKHGTLVATTCLSQILPGTTPRAATLKLQRCSTALGQSGGPLIDAAGNVGGVVAYEVLGPKGYNGGCAMTPWLWLNLVSPNLV